MLRWFCSNTVITIMHGQDTKGSHTSVSPCAGAYIQLRFQHAVMDTYLSYLGCLSGSLLKAGGGGGGGGRGGGLKRE